MKQVIIIGGGTTFHDEAAYLEYLSTKEILPERLRYSPRWKESFQAALDADYDVLIPSMPNTTYAKYAEWKLYFDRVAQILQNDCILIGHSLGGIFLAKYLSEYKLSVRVAGTVLVAAPFQDETSESLGDFKIDALPKLFSQQTGEVHIIGSYDDPVIAPEEFDRYKQSLPEATFHQLSAPDHYVRPTFPELVTIIKGIR